MKRIAVCGYTSAVGEYFLEHFSDRLSFVKIGRSEAEIEIDLRYQKIRGNIDLLGGCDAIVNLAAQTKNDTDEDILDLMKTNVIGPLYLAKLAHQYGIPKYIHMSSISATYEPDDPFYSYYSESKKCADEILMLFGQKAGIRICILRPSALFGSDRFAKHQALLYGLIKKVKQNENITLYGETDVKRNYLHVSTLLDVVYKLIYDDITGVYPVVNMKSDFLTEIISVIKESYGSNIKVRFMPDENGIIERDFDDRGEIYSLLGIDAPNGFRDEWNKMENM